MLLLALTASSITAAISITVMATDGPLYLLLVGQALTGLAGNSMDACMHACMHGDGWMHACMHAWIDGSIDRSIDLWIHRSMDGCTIM